MMELIPEFDFRPIIERHLTAPFRKARDWEIFYAETANAIYETYEFVLKLERRNLTNEDSIVLLPYLATLEPQVNLFMDLMFEAEFESHYYDQLMSELSGIRKAILKIKPRLLKQ